MERLNAQVAAAVSPAAYDVENTGIGIVHIGPGAFHRAHQAVFTEEALEHGGDWRICGVQMRSSGVRDALRPQDYRYTLAIRDEQSSIRVIHALAEVLVGAEDMGLVLERLTAPTTHVVTMTITEKGYCLTPDGDLDAGRPEIIADLASLDEPQSAIGLLVAALQRRRAAGYAAITIISCDNVSSNGRLLEAAVLAFAERVNSSLADWIRSNIAFPCTMVDSITPATDDALRDYVAETAGYDDAMPVAREAFSQWVIEDRFSGPQPAWDRVGVTLTDDIEPFETAKIRLLNGAHSTLAYAGMLAGHDSVREAVTDPGLHDFVRAMMLEEICPTLNPPEQLDLPGYCDEILKRFRNPEIVYRLAQIDWDGSQKVRFRLFATIADNLAAGRPSGRLIYAVAAWLMFVRRCHDDGVEMTDPRRDELLAIAAACDGTGAHDVPLFLADSSLMSDTLKTSDAFAERLREAYDHIASGGRHGDFPLE
ncbi:MAG: mannitol dehydrogenase family protein [Woeseiaceae bacterium]